jgi:hypothetical protein
MHWPMTSQADECSYCMHRPVVLISSRIYLYLQLLWIKAYLQKIHFIEARGLVHSGHKQGSQANKAGREHVLPLAAIIIAVATIGANIYNKTSWRPL